MIDRRFWEDVKNSWCVPAQPDIVQVNTGSGGKIDKNLLKKPWEYEEEDFFSDDELDTIAGKEGKVSSEKEAPVAKSKPALDSAAFDKLLNKKEIPAYAECCRMLLKCELPNEMAEIHTNLADRMTILQAAIDKFKNVYQTDMTEFYDYYIPEALELTASYLEYENAGIDREIVERTKEEVFEATRSLLTAVNDKIDEIYKFASMELQAQAKALADMMGQDGYVDSSKKIN